MECRTARELLDAARPESVDREDAELQAAFAHLDECDACAEVVEFRRGFDRRVGAIVRQVCVPADLQSRLVQALVPVDVAPQVSAVPPLEVRHRRRALILAASAAALLIAAGWSFYAARSLPAPLAAADVLDWWRSELTRQSGFDAAALPEFDGSFDAALGDGRWRSLAQSGPRGADIDRDGTHDAAVFPFVGGFVVVVGPDRVADPPSNASASAATPVYAPVPHVAWTHARCMHICFLPGGTPRQLQQLVRNISSSAA